ncbi:DUF7282 domain-containing protein [Natronomonas sp. EA1]|uniref:DUF7282 domain-containing protein n=1 Tax=Natronomonas sp. EA1 TaxID=3421655 RepID=UPI003EBD34DA
MKRSLVVVLVCALLLAVPASAHVNHATAPPQQSADGTVVVETAFIAVDGWAVVHTDANGKPGEPIGHTALAGEGGLETDVRVTIDDAVWSEWEGARDVWVVLHRDDGDGVFEPDEDNPLSNFGQPAGERFVLERNATAVVTAAGFAPQRVTETVRVRTATLPEAGHLVLHNVSAGERGAVLGVVALSAGTHENVSVPVSGLPADRATLDAVLYTDDGDGQFTEADTPVRAGEKAVATRFGVRVLTGDETPTPTPDESAIVTTATPLPTDFEPPTEAPGDTGTETPTRGTAPGFGVVVAVLALLAAVVLARRRRP